MKTPALALAFGVLVAASAPAAPPDAPEPKPAATPAPAKPRFKFQAYNGDHKAAGAEKDMEFQVKRLDSVQSGSEFLHLGDTIRGTTYKLFRFEYKSRLNTQINETEDVSELTLINTDTKEMLVLALAIINGSVRR